MGTALLSPGASAGGVGPGGTAGPLPPSLAAPIPSSTCWEILSLSSCPPPMTYALGSWFRLMMIWVFFPFSPWAWYVASSSSWVTAN